MQPLYKTAVFFPPGFGEVFHLVWSPAFGFLWLLLGIWVLNTSHDSCIKDLLEVFLSQSRALDVGRGFYFLSTELCSLLRYWLFFALVQLDEDFDILPEVWLCPNQDDGRLGAVAANFGNPLLTHILEGRRAHHAEAQQEDVRVGVAQRPELVEFILHRNKTVLALHRKSSSSLPQPSWQAPKNGHPDHSARGDTSRSHLYPAWGLVAASQQAPCHRGAHRTKVVATPRTWDFPTNAAGYFKCLNISFALCPTSAKKQSSGKWVTAHRATRWRGKEHLLRAHPFQGESGSSSEEEHTTSKLFCRQAQARAKQTDMQLHVHVPFRVPFLELIF